MHKTAQKRSLLNKLREMTNISGIATEKFFNPEFQDLMDRLRDQTDDPVRAIVSGEAIGSASAPDDGVSLKDLLKGVKSSINRREYMTAVAAISRFHRKMYDVVALLKNFNSNVEKIHEKFLFEGLDEDNKRHLHDLKQRLNAYDAAEHAAFIKEANILDFFTNIATERGRALAAWEKRYPKQLGKLKKDTASILQQSERLLSITLSALKEMASARATRNPDNYIKVANDKIIKGFETYDKNFRNYYNENVKGFLEKQDLVSVLPAPANSPNLGDTIPASPLDPGATQVSPVVVPTNTIQDTTTVVAPPVTPPAGAAGTLVGIGPSAAVPPAGKSITRIPGGMLPPVPSILRQSPSTTSPKDTIDDGAPTVRVKPAHSDFMNSLETMSSESPTLLSAHIKRYAKSIQNFDLETSIKLFKLAQAIKE